MRRRQWLAIVLSIVMAVTFIPTIAFAEEEGEAAVEAQPEAEATLEAEPEAEAPAEIDTLDVVKAAEDGDFALDKDSISDEDFDLTGADYGYAVIKIVGDVGIDSIDWEGAELCFAFPIAFSNSDEFNDAIMMKPYREGDSTLIVTGDNGEEIEVPVSVSNETVEKIKYEPFLQDRDWFSIMFYEDPDDEDWDGSFKAYLDLEGFEYDYLDYEGSEGYFRLSRRDFVGKFTARYQGNDYNVKISTFANRGFYDGYEMTIRNMPELELGESFELIFTSGDYTYTVPVRKQSYCDAWGEYEDEFTWTGEDIRPEISVMAELYNEDEDYYDDVALEEGKDYTVEYKYDNGDDAASVGEGCIVVRPCGDYYFESLHEYFWIKPLGTKLGTLTGAKKAMTVKWTKQSKEMSYEPVVGYQIQIATNSKFTSNKKTITVKGWNNASKKITKLKKKKKYWVRIRTYMKDSYGDNIYSNWSAAKTVKTK